jgi:hypothetical protein
MIIRGLHSAVELISMQSFIRITKDRYFFAFFLLREELEASDIDLE